MKKREVWFEYSWALGLWIWPIKTQGWVVCLGAPAVGLVLIGAARLIQTLLPGSSLNLLPLGLLVVLGLVVNYLVITRMQRKGKVREDAINHTARRLFGRPPWRGGIGGGRRLKPLVPDRPPSDT